MLHRLGVEPERDVVDEHPPVDLAEVDPPLTAVDERVEGTDDVVAVDAEIEREVVAGPGRDAGVRQPELGGDRGDDRLRAVPAGHGQPVRAARDGGADQRLEVVTALELDRLDATLAGLLGQREALRFAAAGLRVVEEHRLPRRRRARQIHVHGEGGTRRSQRHQQPRHDQQIDQRRPAGHHQDQRARERQAGDDQPDDPRRPRAAAAPYQAAAPATSTQPSSSSPRGNSLTATATASAIVAAATTSATIAASRRLIGRPYGCPVSGSSSVTRSRQ